MNKIVRIGEMQGGAILDNYFPAIVKWSSNSRATWQKCMDTDPTADFCVYLQIGHVDKTRAFVLDTGWWFSYQGCVEIEFEDGTIKVFKTKNDVCLSEDPETFKEFVEFIDNYVNNGFELYDKTAVVLGDEDDLLVV